jgi:hypothetical protein
MEKINLFNQSYLGSSTLKSDETVHNWQLGAYGAQGNPLHLPNHVQEKADAEPAVSININPIHAPSATQSSHNFQSSDPRIRLYSQIDKII